MVKNDHLGTGGQDLPDQQEPLETGFDIFPYVKVNFYSFLIKNLKIFENKGGLDQTFMKFGFLEISSFLNFSFSICWIQSSIYMTNQVWWCQVSWRFGITIRNWVWMMTSPWRHYEQNDNSKASEKVNYLPIQEHPEQHSLNYFWKLNLIWVKLFDSIWYKFSFFHNHKLFQNVFDFVAYIYDCCLWCHSSASIRSKN